MLASVRNEWIFTNKVYHRILYYEKWCMFSFPSLSLSVSLVPPDCVCLCSFFYWTIKSRRRILRSARPEGTAPVVVHRMRTIYSCKYTQISFFFWQPVYTSRSYSFTQNGFRCYCIWFKLIYFHIIFERILWWHKILSTNNVDRNTCEPGLLLHHRIPFALPSVRRRIRPQNTFIRHRPNFNKFWVHDFHFVIYCQRWWVAEKTTTKICIGCIES